VKLYRTYILFALFSFFCHANQYIYPVAVLESEKGFFLFVLHQEGPDSLQLYMWDPDTDIMQKGLSARFSPTSLQIIPGQKGFSFIDAGRIRIKQFLKKSPRALEPDQPLYGFSTVVWLDEQTLCTSAKRGNYFGIFQICVDGHVDTIVAQEGFDFLYPQKVDDLLFCVGRDTENCFLVQGDYPKIPKQKNFSGVEAILAAEKRGQKSLLRSEEATIFYDAPDDQQIVFLYVPQKDCCFFVQHPNFIDSEDETIQFSYHRLTRDGSLWNHTELFQFSIPTKLLFSKQHRMHESLRPFIPRHAKEKIYFSDCSDNYEKLNIFSFDIITGKKEQKTFASGLDYFFAPFILKQNLFYGKKQKNLSDKCLDFKSLIGDA